MSTITRLTTSKIILPFSLAPKLFISCSWGDKSYKTTVIFGGRQNARFFFRDPRYSLNNSNEHPFSCRYCDCPGYVYSMRKNLKQPKRRQECKHVYNLLDHLEDSFLAQELCPGDKSVLDTYEKDLSTACTQYLGAIDAQEEWPHKTTIQERVVHTREIYHKIQESCMRELASKPLLYAHATQENYPHIHKIK